MEKSTSITPFCSLRSHYHGYPEMSKTVPLMAQLGSIYGQCQSNISSCGSVNHETAYAEPLTYLTSAQQSKQSCYLKNPLTFSLSAQQSKQSCYLKILTVMLHLTRSALKHMCIYEAHAVPLCRIFLLSNYIQHNVFFIPCPSLASRS